MYYVYVIESELTEKYYFGYTSNYSKRWNTHVHFSKTKKTKLYNHVRKHGIDNFEMVVIDRFESKQDALEFEKHLISRGDDNCLNLAPGGEGGFVVVDKSQWQTKLSKARAERKPALGMKHTKENKKKFSDFGRLRWDMYGRYPEVVTSVPFKDAKKLYGISKTHYYRLLKQAKANDLG